MRQAYLQETQNHPAAHFSRRRVANFAARDALSLTTR